MRSLLRHVAVSASVSLALGALAGPASAATYAVVGSTLATGAVATGIISPAALLASEALDGRWAAIARTGGGHGAALSAALKEVLTVVSLGALTGGVMGTLAHAVATSHSLVAAGSRWGVAFLTLAGAQTHSQVSSDGATRSRSAPGRGPTPLAMTLAALDDAVAAEGVGSDDDSRAATASQALERFALVSATPHVTLLNRSSTSVRLVSIPLVPATATACKRGAFFSRSFRPFMLSSPRALFADGCGVLRLDLRDGRVQTLVTGQVAPLASIARGTGAPPGQFIVFPQLGGAAWSNMRSDCRGGTTVPCAMLPPPRAAARMYVVTGSILTGAAISEVTDALLKRLSESEAALECIGLGGRGRRGAVLQTAAVLLAQDAAEPSACGGVCSSDTERAAPRLLLHNSARTTARLVVAMTTPQTPGGCVRERVVVSAPAGTPLFLPDAATDILVMVDLRRASAFGEAWCASACGSFRCVGGKTRAAGTLQGECTRVSPVDGRVGSQRGTRGLLPRDPCATRAPNLSRRARQHCRIGSDCVGCKHTCLPLLPLLARSNIRQELEDSANTEQDTLADVESDCAVPEAVHEAVRAWAATVRATARPREAAWHDDVATQLRDRTADWRHALVLAERVRHGPAASMHRLRPMRQAVRAFALRGRCTLSYL